jgi:phosphatidylglycerol phospholipase C
MLAKKYFWDGCDVFSMKFGSLTTSSGERYALSMIARLPGHLHYFFRFRKECQSAGKLLMVWTVNDPSRMMEVRNAGDLGSPISSRPHLGRFYLRLSDGM